MSISPEDNDLYLPCQHPSCSAYNAWHAEKCRVCGVSRDSIQLNLSQLRSLIDESDGRGIISINRDGLLQALSGEGRLSLDSCQSVSSSDETPASTLQNPKSSIENKIGCPYMYDPEVFKVLPEELQREIAEEFQRGVAENPSQGKKKRNREVRSLNDHLSSGLNDSAPNNSSVAANFKDDGASRKRGRTNGYEVLVHDWYHADHEIKDGERAHVIGDRPIFYHSDSPGPEGFTRSVPNDLIKIKDELQKQILEFSDVNEAKISMVEELTSCEKLDNGYYRGHISDALSRFLSGYLPGPFQVKQSADKKGIVFFSSTNTQCCTHFDRDSAILYVLSGSKEVFIARPIANAGGISIRAEDGMFPELDPFANDRDESGYIWEKVHMCPGSALFIPKDWLHSVRSAPNTLALSMQVEAYKQIRKTIKSEAKLKSAEYCESTDSKTPDSALTSKQPTPAECKSGTTVDRKPSAVYPQTSIAGDVRKSRRVVPKCGICSKIFSQSQEMWLLRYQGTAAAESLPEYPTMLAKHLVCMDCCPRNGSKGVAPKYKITFPDGQNRSIITGQEFKRANSCFKARDLDKYEFISASYGDYQTNVINGGKAIWGQAGQSFSPNLV